VHVFKPTFCHLYSVQLPNLSHLVLSSNLLIPYLPLEVEFRCNIYINGLSLSLVQCATSKLKPLGLVF
jgi:hypothetical protein